MKTILMAVIVLTLTACSGPLKLLAAQYNSQDECQNQVQPSWCGASNGTRLVTRDYYTGRYISTSQVTK